MNLKTLRQERGLPQYRLAGIAGVPLSEVYRIERRGMRPTHTQAERLAEALGVDVSDVEELRRALPEEGLRRGSS